MGGGECAKRTVLANAISYSFYSLVPRPLPDFISQLWRKIGRRPGTITTSRTGNVFFFFFFRNADTLVSQNCLKEVQSKMLSPEMVDSVST